MSFFSGGLLSAYHLTSESTILIKAADLGERLIHCFDTPNHFVPFSDVNLKTKNPKTPNWSPDSSLSEATSVQLEFRDLSYLTGVPKYEVKYFD
jgi:mannosyl-oligosaccharide alpha-1,2-mannosidase